MEKCIGCELCAGVCPADCIYVRGARQPAGRPRLARRAVRVRLRDQLPALHPLRPLRRGVPDRGDHRVEAVRVLLHEPRGRHLHQGRARRRRRRRPQHLPWEDWRAGEDQHTSGWMRATSPSGAVDVRGHGRSGRASSATASGCRGRPERQPRRRGHREHLHPHGGARTRSRGASAARCAAHDEPVAWPRHCPTRVTFAVAAVIVRGRVARRRAGRNPVHSALMLVMTLFGVAVLFIEQNAEFLAAVQVIVYAGAIVVLFLFVIMLLGVDRKEVIGAEPLRASGPWRYASGSSAWPRSCSSPRHTGRPGRRR